LQGENISVEAIADDFFSHYLDDEKFAAFTDFLFS
jgi:hypothetical protein